MDPLFENRMTVDKNALNEWYAVEFGRYHLGYRVFCIVWIIACLGIGAWCLSIYAVLGGWAFIAGALIMLVLAGVLAVNLLLRHRLYVWALLRNDKGENYPAEVATLFTADQLVLLRLAPGTGGAGTTGAAGYAAEAEKLKAEFTQALGQAENLPTAGLPALAEFRGKLEDIRDRMEALNRSVDGVVGESRQPYSGITGYLQTQTLHVIYFAGTAALVRKDGFTLGTEAGFSRFLYNVLAAAARDNPDKKIRRALHKALADYFTADDNNTGKERDE